MNVVSIIDAISGPDPQDQLLQQLNQQFFVVPMNGKTRVGTFTNLMGAGYPHL